MPDNIKIKNRSFRVFMELRNIKRTGLPDKDGRYTYSFDFYIEGRLVMESATIYAKNMDWIIYRVKTEGLKPTSFL